MDDVTTFTEHETLVGLKSNIQKNIKDIIGINVSVTFKEPGSIERSEGKAQRVVDLRKEQERLVGRRADGRAEAGSRSRGPRGAPERWASPSRRRRRTGCTPTSTPRRRRPAPRPTG